MQSTDILKPNTDEIPSAYADRLGLHYSSVVTQVHKKENGQFFTPTEIAHFMASLSNIQSQSIRILDPGCGTAVLTCALIERLVYENKNLKEVEFIGYETDADLIPFSEASLINLRNWLIGKGIEAKHFLHENDFIL